MVSSPRGRYCDDRIGAVGHPYWQFAEGKVDVVACGELIHHGSYSHAPGGWIWINDFKAEKLGLQTNRIELHWWGISTGQGLDRLEFHRCRHFWMNSRGPLWHPWDS